MGTIGIQKNQLINFIEKKEILTINTFNGSTLNQKDEFVESFWYYKTYQQYLNVIGVVVVALALLTAAFKDSEVFVATMGTWSSVIEAMLGVPQFYLNFSKKNTQGLAPLLIMMWLFGDFYKLTYYISTSSPIQLIFCSVFQICTDVSILSQFWIYRENNNSVESGGAHANK